jgi:chemotaxis-related protein WspB
MLLLTFTAGGNRFAIDAARVIELVPRVQLRPIPRAPAYFAGLLAYRGKVVPVIDLGLLLDADASRDRLSTRIILVDDAPGDHNHGTQEQDAGADGEEGFRAKPKQSSSLLGLIAEQVSDLTHANPEELAPAPVELPRVPYLDAIVQTDQGIVQLIAVERIRPAALAGLSYTPAAADRPESGRQDSEQGFEAAESQT